MGRKLAWAAFAVVLVVLGIREHGQPRVVDLAVAALFAFTFIVEMVWAARDARRDD